MKARISIEKEYEVKYLQVDAGVRYWEDSEINGQEDSSDIPQMPCVYAKREKFRWMPLINVDNGKIINWNKSVNANIHYKVCDDGEYTLLDNDQKVIIKVNGYVPSILAPSENNFGDYIIMKVDKNGYIQDWHCDEYDIQEIT